MAMDAFSGGYDNVEKMKNMYDKRAPLAEAVRRFLKDGITISIGGFGDTRIPIASIHQIIRQGARGLTISVPSNSICCELLAGAMILNSNHLSIHRIEISWHDNEKFYKTALLSYLIRKKMVLLDEYSAPSMLARYQARAIGVPFLPIKEDGSDERERGNRGKVSVCPFTGEKIRLVPACNPDLALIHVQAADIYGNCRIFGDLCTCPHVAQASVNTIVTTEQVIDNSAIQNYPNLTTIPYHVVDVVVDQPFGSTPAACYGNYEVDSSQLQEFRSIGEDFCRTGNTDKLRNYYNQSIFDIENFDDFLEQKPYPILHNLCQLESRQSIILD